MGSLVLIPPNLDQSCRSFGQEVARGEFDDADGVLVSVAINADKEGRLFELDVWKTNFAPLVALPGPSAIRIVRLGRWLRIPVGIELQRGAA